MISYLAVVLFCMGPDDCYFYNRMQTFDKQEQCKAFVVEVQGIIEKQYPVLAAQCLKVDAGTPI